MPSSDRAHVHLPPLAFSRSHWMDSLRTQAGTLQGFLVVIAVCWIGFANISQALADSPTLSDSPELPAVYGGRVHANWAPDGNEFWYESFGPNWKRTYWWVNAASGKRTQVFDGAKLHDALDKAQVINLDKDLIAVNDIHRSGKDQLQLDILGFRFTYNPSSNYIKYDGEVQIAPRPLRPLPAVIKSDDTSEKTTITFINHRRRPVSVWWVHRDGTQTNQGPISNWQEWELFVGSVSVVKSDNGDVLGTFQAVADPSQAVVDDLEVPTTQAAPERKAVYAGSIWQPQEFRDNNLYLCDPKTNEKFSLTADARAGDGYDPGNTILHWAPDSIKMFITRTINDSQPLNMIQSSPPDQLQPRLVSVPFYRPTDKVLVCEPQVFDVVQRKKIPIHYDSISVKPCFIRDVAWSTDSTHVSFTEVDRGCQTLRVITVDANTGRATVPIEERSETFVDAFSDAKKYYRFAIPETSEFVWTSERDGWNHAYLYDAVSGKLKNQITRGPWVVRDVLRIDARARQLLCEVGGLVRGEDPYHVHVVRINFDGTGLLDLTPADGMHAIEFSPDARFYLDTYSRIDLPPVTELRRTADAKLIGTVERGDWSERVSAGWQPPEPFVAKGRDGKTDIYGVIYRPDHFDPTRKYPVVEEVYAGPQTICAEKSFSLDSYPASLAERGFIVVQSDGMGSNFRSKAFHDVCWRNLADAGFPDRILFIRAAAAKYPQMDLSRVGIYGGSAGGRNAVRALESYGDFYGVAVAAFGAYDDRLTSDSEKWMGWPVGPWYALQSDVNDAGKINGKLLLISGELDHIVDPASTMQMANALIKANKDFDLLVIPNADHGPIGHYGSRRREDFFVQHLMNAPPSHLVNK